jgi:hypothetical protein
VSDPGRFQRKTRRAEQQGVTTWAGVDAVTGLPVVIYELSDRPLREAERLESEHIPGTLATAFDGERGELVAAFSAEYRPLRSADVDDLRAAMAAAALHDAARAGVVHGDLRAERFLAAGGHLLVEGYGVPWQASATGPRPPEGGRSLAGDVYAFAATFLDLGRERISSQTVALLVRATSDDPAQRPPAEELAATLATIAAIDPQPQPQTPPRAPDPEPMVIDTDPGGAPLRTGAAKRSTGGFSKEPPPGTRYRSGKQTPAPPPGRFNFPSLHDGRILGDGTRRWYRFAVLGATLLLTAVLAILALSQQSDGLGDPTSTQSVMYVVDVAVQPQNLPPVTLYVVSAPEASRWQPGTALGTVPGRVVLDQPGTWRLQGRFQDRLSEVVILALPEDRAVTLAFPSAASEAQP